MVLVIFYPVGAKSLNRAVTQSAVFQNSYSGWKVEDKGMRKRLGVRKPNYGDCIALVRHDKGPS